MNNLAFRARLLRSWPLLALLLIAAVWLYRTPYSASNLEIPPDTGEYALAPLQFLETGRYEIVVGERELPPRYPPWFPVLTVLPAYVVFGHDPGNAILPITMLAVAGVGFAYAIGKRISGITGGALAGLAVLTLPSYAFWATEVMTDVPCTALMLGTCIVFLELRGRPDSIGRWFAAGVLVAITTLFRPVFAAMLLPFALTIISQRKRVLLRGLLLFGPMAGAASLTFAYDAATFGSPFRDGYKFWVALPMDYPRMIFSLSYLPTNLRVIGLGIFPVLLLVCLGTWLVVRKRRPAALASSWQSFRDTGLFVVLTTGPILVFHLLYFFPGERFHIPMVAGTAILTASILAVLIGSKGESLLKLLLPAVFVFAIAARLAVDAPLPLRRLAAERVRKYTPDNAMVISAIDPVYLGRFTAAGSSRRIVPLSRNVEYASKFLVRKRVEDTRLRGLKWNDERAVALIRPHAEEAVRFVASERMDELASALGRGSPIFFESMFADPQDAVVVELRTRFNLIQRAPFLYELLPR